MEEIGRRIQEIRRAYRLSRKVFAEKLGCSQMTVYRWERGERVIDVNSFSKIVRVFNVNPTWLLTGEGPMFKTEGMDREMEEIIADLERIRRDFGDRHYKKVLNQIKQLLAVIQEAGKLKEKRSK